jgi:hypothetical protein
VSRPAWTLWTVAAALTAATWAVSIGVPGSSRLGLACISAAGLVFMTVGSIVNSRLPAHRIGWLFLAIGLLVALGIVTDAYANRALQPDSELPAASAAAVVANLLQGAPIIGLITALILLFPDGRLPSPRWRWAARALVVACSAALLGSLLAPGPLNVGDLDNPLAVSGTAADIAVALQGAGFAGMVAIIVTAAGGQLRRFRRSSGLLREQLKWLVASTSLLAICFGSAIPLWSVSAGWSGVVWTLLFTLSTASIPIATGIAILRFRLYEIDVLIRRTVTYTVLVAILGAGYLAGIWLLGGLLRTLTGASGALAVTITTLAVWAGFQPLRTRVQAAVDHRFARRRYDANRTLAGLSARLRDRVELESIEGELLALVDATVQPRHASLWLRKDAP